ncbi:MAG: MTAP family purine nucleoside phosphorylase [Caldiserica bacterium]|nr:MTAP family purine nucleoside phosphorylase [Caldisericota bacterium]
MSRPVGLIVGTGVDSVQVLSGAILSSIKTPFGDVGYVRGSMGGADVCVLKRHGEGHVVPPHLINYRANIMALYMLGVEKVVTTSAVGSLRESIAPGSYALMDGFLDFTKVRAQTFFEVGKVVHTDMTHPYSAAVTDVLGTEMIAMGLSLHTGEVYVAAEGPRFESPQEVRMYAAMGGSVVGMTGVPEVTLAREAGLEYQTIAIVTNYAAGISVSLLTHKEVLDAMAAASASLIEVLRRSLPRIAELPAGQRDDQHQLDFLLNT